MTEGNPHLDLESLKEDYIQLQERERKLRDIIDMLPETVYETDLEGRVTFVNDAGLALFGYSRDDFLKGLEARNMFCDYEIERLYANLRKVLKGERRQSTEYMALRKDGTAFPILVHSRVVFRGDVPIGTRGVLIDLTENYRIRKQLEREKDFVNSLLDTANSLVICLDTNENIIMFNKECEKLTGYKLEEVRGKHWPKTFIPAESRRKSDLPFSEWIKKHPEDRYEAPLTTKSGENKTILWSNTVFSPKDSDEVIALAIGHDVTEQTKALKALQESEKHYRAVWDNLPVGICLTDRDGIYRYVNPAYCKIYGYDKEDLIGNLPDGLIFPHADPEERKKYYNERFDRQIPAPLKEYQFSRSDGSAIWVEVSADFIRENGKPKFRITMNVDVTSRKTAELALKESEQRYSLLFQNINEAVVIQNKDGVIEMMNNAAASYLGGKPEDFVGKHVRDMFPPAIARRQITNILEAINESKQKTLFQDYNFPDNGKKWFNIVIYPIKDTGDNSSSALIIGRDVTEDLRKEEILKARFKLFDNLRKSQSIDRCLELGCDAIFEAGLFKRSVLTLHNENKDITNLGSVGLDEGLVSKARKSKAPSQSLSRKMTQRKFRISNSYFIPAEAALNYKTTERYIPADINHMPQSDFWHCGDELFIPVFGSGNGIIGWLSVDTPFDGRRPSFETVRLLEEITDIATQRVKEISNQKILNKERKSLAEKNVALKEILGHIEEEKEALKQRFTKNMDQFILPVLNRMIDEPGMISKSNLIVLKNSLEELGSLSAGIAQLYSRLSTREIEICNLIKADWTSKEIASSLNISVTTIHKHRETIRRKLGLTNKDVNLKSYIKGL